MNTTTLPIEFVRDIYAALAGKNAVDFDADDFSALPAQCEVSASFGVSHTLNDTASAVDSAWPYPAGTQHVDALVVVRGNGMDMARYKSIQGELRHRLHDTSTLLISVNQCGTLPPGAVSIILLVIARKSS